MSWLLAVPSIAIAVIVVVYVRSDRDKSWARFVILGAQLVADDHAPANHISVRVARHAQSSDLVVVYSDRHTGGACKPDEPGREPGSGAAVWMLCEAERGS